MEKLAFILIAIGIFAAVFSALSFIQILRHIRGIRNNGGRATSTITDDRYFELRTKSDYIIAIGTILIALLTIVGFGTVGDIKKEYQDGLKVEKERIDSTIDASIRNYLALDTLNTKYKGSVKEGLLSVEALKKRVGEIQAKDIVRQNIYIVDPIKIDETRFEKDAFTTIKFSDLKTIYGQPLPKFQTPPSLICYSAFGSLILTKDVTKESFRIRADYPAGNGFITFGLWISQKPGKPDFNSDFSSDFK